MPDLTLPCLGSNTPVRLRALSTPVLVNLWASWCAPCRSEMPRLQNAYAGAGGRLAFLGVDTEDSAADAAAFLRLTGVKYPNVFDPSGTLARQIGTAGLPVTLVVDRTGKVAYRHFGELKPADLAQAFAAAGVSPGQVTGSAGATPRSSP